MKVVNTINIMRELRLSSIFSLVFTLHSALDKASAYEDKRYSI